MTNANQKQVSDLLALVDDFNKEVIETSFLDLTEDEARTRISDAESRLLASTRVLMARKDEVRVIVGTPTDDLNRWVDLG